MSKQEFRTDVLAELRGIEAALRRIAVVVEMDSKIEPAETKPYEGPMLTLTDEDLVGIEIDGKVVVERWGNVKPGIRP